ncbi:MAG: hypothetical protein ACI8XU_001257 [Kiritimatiellia bacterium]|jgi:hypothetical protein
MKKLLIVILSAFIIGPVATAQHGSKKEEAPSSVSLRENDFALCGQPFYDNLYALTVEIFADGASKVMPAAYAEQVFALVRSSEEFAGSADAFVDHIKDIPRQLVEIIREDPQVLASCENFSVALVGPP